MRFEHDVHIDFCTNILDNHVYHINRTTMSFLGGSSAPTGASQTQAIKQQVAQEAAVANARQLVEVHPPLFTLLRSPKCIHMLTYHRLIRNSTNTASNAASPNPALRCRQASQPATLSAWKSTCRPGTSCPSNTSIAYRERLVPEAVV